jgi:hypothetical protein
MTADERDAWTEIRQVDSIAGWGGRNKGVGPAEKANDNAATFVSELLDHATLPTRIGAQRGRDNTIGPGACLGAKSSIADVGVLAYKTVIYRVFSELSGFKAYYQSYPRENYLSKTRGKAKPRDSR